MTEFAGKVAIVTGGGSGLGEAIGKLMARRGAKVVLSDINLKSAERVAQEIGAAGETARAVEQDTGRSEDSERVVNEAVTAYGALHYAVNNAGIAGAHAPAGEVDLADWARVININLNGVLYGMRYQIPAMLKACARECAIVNMASIHGTVARPSWPASRRMSAPDSSLGRLGRPDEVAALVCFLLSSGASFRRRGTPSCPHRDVSNPQRDGVTSEES